MSEQPDLMPVAAEDALPAQRDALSVLLDNPESLERIPVETVERLHAIHKEERDDARTVQFNRDFLAVQDEITPVLKQGWNDQTKSRYAKLEDVHAMLKPLLRKHGFGATVSGRASPRGDEWTTYILTLRHRSGRVETHEMDLPIDDKGIKGTSNKTKMHGSGSAINYARRYILCSVFDVALTEDDNDGNRVEEPITPEQVTELLSLAEQVGANKSAFLAWLNVGTLDELPASQFNKAKHGLEARRGRG